MRIVFFLLLTASCYLCKAQTPQHGPKIEGSSLDSTTQVEVHPYFMLDTQEAFFTWDIEPQNFEFLLFDRWGYLVAKTQDPHFIIDNILLKDKKTLQQDVYIAQVSFTGIGGVKRTFRTHYNYLGFYCGG